MPRYARRLFGTEHPPSSGRLVRLQTLPNGALCYADHTAKRSLATSDLDGFRERFGRGHFDGHDCNL